MSGRRESRERENESKVAAFQYSVDEIVSFEFYFCWRQKKMFFGFKNMNKCNQSFFREYKKAVFLMYMNKKDKNLGFWCKKGF